MNSILVATPETKIRFRHRKFAAAHVQGLQQATDEESKGFAYSGQKLTKISEPKIKERIFFCPQLKQIFVD